MQNIRTKWHKMLSLIEQDEVYLSAEKGGMAPHWAQYNPNLPGFNDFIKRLGELPKFVIDSDLLELVMADEYTKSLVDMKKANLLRAPYPAMIIEFAHDRRSYITLLRDLADYEPFPWEGEQSSKYPFYGLVFRIEDDENGNYLVLSPTISCVDVEEKGGEPWIGICANPFQIFQQTEKLSQLIEGTYVKDAAIVFRAVAAAMLVMRTEGVKQEVIETTRLNKKRVLHNKPPIPRHVVLSIGHVYRSSGSDKSDEYEARRSPRPHWRRGHLRTVHYGTNRVNVKEVYIKPKLVAYKEDFTVPEPPAKTYDVKR